MTRRVLMDSAMLEMEATLEERNVSKSLADQVLGIVFANHIDNPVYVSSARQLSDTEVEVEMGDGTKFLLTCKKL